MLEVNQVSVRHIIIKSNDIVAFKKDNSWAFRLRTLKIRIFT